MRGVLAAVTATVVAAVAAQAGVAAPGPKCGGTLWKMMTLADTGKGVNWNPSVTTVGEIAKLTAPAKVATTRTTAFQKRVWKLDDVVIDSYRVASSGEIVLKLYDVPSATYMNAYVPATSCMTANATLRKAMVKARNGLVNSCPAPKNEWQMLGAHAVLFGVGFWNPLKTTPGALKSGAELRPLVGLTITQGCGKY
jgi:hypothetical protein